MHVVSRILKYPLCVRTFFRLSIFPPFLVCQFFSLFHVCGHTFFVRGEVCYRHVVHKPSHRFSYSCLLSLSLRLWFPLLFFLSLEFFSDGFCWFSFVLSRRRRESNRKDFSQYNSINTEWCARLQQIDCTLRCVNGKTSKKS